MEKIQTFFNSAFLYKALYRIHKRIGQTGYHQAISDG
jgi:hypothetical protein